jgi:hypothetical protein
MLRLVRGLNFEFLCELLKRVLKKEENVRLFFTSRNAAVDIVLQSAVPVAERKLTVERWVKDSKEFDKTTKVVYTSSVFKNN